METGQLDALMFLDEIRSTSPGALKRLVRMALSVLPPDPEDEWPRVRLIGRAGASEATGSKARV